MQKRILGASIVVVLLALAVAGQKLEPPKLEPKPSTASQKQMIDEGVALHDRGDYDAAIRLYEQVLRENPANVEALYEMAFTYYLKQDCVKSLEMAYKAAQYKSNLLGEVYGQIGNCQDDLGNPKAAVETYKAGIKLMPASFLLHYNLGLTYARLSQIEDARIEVKKSASLNPNHASSHNLMSIAFDRGGYKTPALLAACRFLILEPKSNRSETALTLVQKIMQAGASQKDANTITVLMDPSPKKDEGDFGSIELVLGLLRAGNLTENKKDKSEMELLVDNFGTLFSILSEQSGKSDRAKFTWTYYVPYFAELKKQGHTEAFAYYINQRSSISGVDKWLEQHQSKVADFLNWSKGYQWPGI
ncbi:MAG: tetratricopeptide repeat protein [Pyrinomonadaceae bacterium]